MIKSLKLIKSMLLYGVMLWLVPFIASFALYPVHTGNRPLFETIMSIIIVGSAVLFTNLYFRKLDSDFIKEGVMVGIIWAAICLAFDLPVFLWGFKQTLAGYLGDIGLVYLIIPIITISSGILMQRQTVKSPE